jgi:hypothetical protein
MLGMRQPGDGYDLACTTTDKATAPGRARMTEASAPTRTRFVRSILAGRDLELFMVTSIATILIVRAALAATGWPQLGGGKIHFAHLLWGGLGMLIALVLFMSMEGRLWKLLATLSAGIGFGLFIDELGKFITSDNDYFFRPVVALIYLVFVVLFLVTRALVTTDHPSPTVALVNLLGLVAEAAVRRLNDSERVQALHLLAACDHNDPMVRQLEPVVEGIVAQASAEASVYERVRMRLVGVYGSLVAKRWFKALLGGCRALVALGNLVVGLAVLIAAVGGESLTAGFWSYGGVISSIVSAALVVVGLVRWRHSRLAAYRWFQRALLVTIFVTELFAFYQNQISQVLGLFIVLLTYAAVRAMIHQEESAERSRAAQHQSPAVLAVQVGGEG